ncbi:MAG: hypothetical protein NXI32_01080 [bacterium]|nr:hypothetical protein [bacterium]
MPSTKAPLGSLDETRLRKIALLICSVDATAAQQLMLQLPSEIAAEVRAIMATLSRPESSEQQRLLEELQRLAANTVAATGGQRPIDGLTGEHHACQQSSPNWWTRNTDDIADILIHERPPVIAAIISRLPADECIELLKCFSSQLSAQILSCISKLRELDTVVESEIDDYMASKCGNQPGKQNPPQGSRRLRQLNAILEAAPDELQHQWRKALVPAPQKETTASTHNSPRTDAVQPDHPRIHEVDFDADNAEAARAGEHELSEFQNMPTAEDGCWQDDHTHSEEFAEEPTDHLELLHRLTDTELVSLFDRADAETLVVALAGADPALIDRLTSVLDSDRLSAIDEGMKQLEHLQLGDIDEAQQRLVVLAQQISPIRRLAS